MKPITAVFLNTTIIGVELLVKNDPTIPDDQKYITSYVSTPTVDVRFGRHPYLPSIIVSRRIRYMLRNAKNKY